MVQTDDDSEKYTYDVIKSIANNLMERIKIRPKVAIICGSGLGNLGDFITERETIDYKDIPNFPVSAVKANAGHLVFGILDGMPVLAMQGRFHYYEGYTMAKCSMPIRVMKLMGILHVIGSNAAGGLNPKYKIGDIMIIHDHINWAGIAGNSPLRGPNDVRFGPRFVPVVDAYTPHLIQKAKKVATELGIENDLHVGVYSCVGGPTYETIAELKMLRMVGADAVGMSIVNEVITARHCGLNVFAFSLITDKSPVEYQAKDTSKHASILNIVNTKQKVCVDLVRGVIREIARDSD